ncbi:timeless-domain-containing protein [Calocera cornea HHB12733]|uniref:Timeless-domain-containing protein n=1 Tax=Calocera cornea HHB12733 TaxID=1353952 RepID=A0A165EB82_9BASI|nr:timeless-domain-containing protein [Calocera cornea HHB12733]
MSSDSEDSVSVTLSTASERAPSPDPIPQTLYDILSVPITNTISALGAPSPADKSVYVLGDDVLGCLRDLKRYWRRDDNDEERTVARIFAKANLLENDLVPILVQTAEKLPKVAVACADLITSMTWPMDLPAELQELHEQGITGPSTDYPLLIRALLSYKSAITHHPGAVRALVLVALPPLAVPPNKRSEREKQIVNVVLHCLRNVLAIRDLRGDVNKSGDWGELASLQSMLIRRLKDSGFLDVLATLTSNADTPVANAYSSVMLEIWYLMYRGVPAAKLTLPSAQRPKEELRSLLETEGAMRRGQTKATRHSRFGTAIVVTAMQGKEKFVMSRQQGLRALPGETMDAKKRGLAKRTKHTDDLGPEQSLSHDALNVLKEFAVIFLNSCFNTFFASLLKDIRYERPHITEADNVRLLVVSSWFVEFFLAARARADQDQTEADKSEEEKTWTVGKVAECCEQEWIVWVVKRMRFAGDEKPKAWVELQACMEALTQLLLLIECMSNSRSEDLREAALALQHKLWFSSELMDVALVNARTYTGQSLAYLESVVQLNYVLLKLLERYAKGRGDMYVKKKTNAKKKKTKSLDEEGTFDDGGDDEEQDQGPSYEQRRFEFEGFELRFANEDITHTLLAYLARYREISAEGALGSEKIKWVVSLLHRQVVKAKAEGLFFKVSTLELFRHILNDERTLPNDAPHKELVQLVRYTLRQFFKEAEKKPFLLVEAFFPKNRNRWKEYSSYQPPEKTKRVRPIDEDDNGPREVQIKGTYSWSEQLGIAMACLIEDGQQDLVDWVRELLVLAVAERQAIVAMTDPPEAVDLDGEIDDDEIRQRRSGPSEEAMSKFIDFVIRCEKDGQQDAATKNPHLKLMFRLVKFQARDEVADPMEWYCPATILPSEMEESIKVIDHFLANPFDLDGKKATTLLKKKPKKRRRRNLDDEMAELFSDDEVPRKRREKRNKEKQQYKSAQFIQDSDGDEEAEEAFFRKEAELRAKMAEVAEQTGNTMRATGTKKRKKKGEDSRKKRRKTGDAEDPDLDLDIAPAQQTADHADSSDSDAEFSQPSTSLQKRSTPGTTPLLAPSSPDQQDSDVEMENSPQPEKAKAPPRPRRVMPKPKAIEPTPSKLASPVRAAGKENMVDSDDDIAVIPTQASTKVRRRLVFSDDEDE